jgi:hypothetical protein
VETDTVQTVLVAPSMAGAERRPSIAKVTVHHVEAATEVMVSALTAPAALSTVGAEPPQPIAVQPLPLDQLLHNLVPFQLPPRVAGRVEAATEVMVSVLTAPAALSTVGAEPPRPIAVQPVPLDLLPHLQLPPVQQEAVRPQSTPLLDLSPLLVDVQAGLDRYNSLQGGNQRASQSIVDQINAATRGYSLYRQLALVASTYHLGVGRVPVPRGASGHQPTLHQPCGLSGL